MLVEQVMVGAHPPAKKHCIDFGITAYRSDYGDIGYEILYANLWTSETKARAINPYLSKCIANDEEARKSIAKAARELVEREEQWGRERNIEPRDYDYKCHCPKCER